ncbi:MAG TPA: hypothetical protein VKZ72_00320 [Acidimicrobiales bacterium]|nr:hypothetical protein [Acidimicrobiales bacterium]
MRLEFHFTPDPSAEARVRAAAAQAISDVTEALLTDANRTVPHDRGDLERSGVASVDTGALRGAVSYNTPYAVIQHESLHFHHPGKGRAKWLELTMVERASAYGAYIADVIRRALG